MNYRTGLFAILSAAGLSGIAVAVPAASPSPTTSTPSSIEIAQGPSFLGTVEPTGTKRPESAVWWNDGSWWANMWDTQSRHFHIFRFSPHLQRWVKTRSRTDRRADTSADTLWDGSHLYIASHKQLKAGQAPRLGPPSFLYRFSYSHRGHRYALDRGFPTVINHSRTKTLVIEKDTAGKLWATWQRGEHIYIAPSTGRGRRWKKSFRLPFPQAHVTTDDISSLVSFSRRVGVMWSNQRPGPDGFWFSIHVDRAPSRAWQRPEAALAGGREADDHINLKSDSGGAVYAAVKTSNIGMNPLVLLLRRRSGGGWTSSVYGTAPSCHNRPTLVIDERRRLIHMFATAPAPPVYTCTSSGGAIYEKSATQDAISFPIGRGAMVMNDARSPFIHNASTSKRNVRSSAGILLLAVNQKTHEYWTWYAK
jgi:hypothetical protein